MTELRVFTGDGIIDGACDDTDEICDVGERRGGESVVPRFCATLSGVSVLAFEMTGRIVSARVLGRRSRESLRALALCCKFVGCAGSGVSKCELSRWSTVNEERRCGTLTTAGDPRGEKVAGCFFSESFVEDSDGSFSFSPSNLATLGFPRIERGFLMIEDALLPMLLGGRSELRRSRNAKGFAGEGVVGWLETVDKPLLSGVIVNEFVLEL